MQPKFFYLIILNIFCILYLYYFINVYKIDSISNKHESMLINKNKNEFKDSLNFIVIGDWGGIRTKPYYSKIQLKVSKSMIDYSKKVKISFIISTGDNFYDQGLRFFMDSRILHTFENVYLKNDEKFSNINWYLVAGNHDHHTKDNAKYQLSSYNAYLPKQWNFPDFLYTKKLILLNANKQMKTFRFIFIDTTIMCNLYEKKLVGNLYNSINQTYYNLFRNQLIMSHNQNESIILIGHHPLYSSQSSEKPLLYCFHDNFLNLFKNYPIIAYFSGHDHSLQYGIYHKVHLFTSAGGSEFYHKPKLNDSDIDKNYKSHFYYADDGKHIYGGFLAVKLSINRLKFSFIDNNGKKLYENKFSF